MTTEQLTEWLAERGPLLVEEARFDDPVLRLGGRGGGLTINASWRVLAADRTFAFSGGMVEATELVDSLIGVSIVGCDRQGLGLRSDPTLILSDGRWVEVFSDDEGAVPWALGGSREGEQVGHEERK